MSHPLLILPAVLAMLLLAAVFCAVEVAFLYASRARLHQLARQGNPRAKLALELLQRPDVLLATLVLVMNTINIGGSALTTALLVRLFGGAGVAYATIIMAVAVFLFSEALPKTLGTRFPEAIALAFAHPTAWLEKLLAPVVLPVRAFNHALMRLAGVADTKRAAFTEADLRGALSLGLEHGTIHGREYRMLDAVLNLDDLTVRDIMVHRSAIVALDAATPPQQLPRVLAALGHSRLPVFAGAPDKFIGILYVRDYLKALGQVAKRSDLTLKPLLRPLPTTAETTPLGRQMMEFLKTHNHLSFVIDAKHEITGLVTLEDILEEIVGDIADEPDSAQPLTLELGADGSITLPGRLPVASANHAYGWQLPEDEAVTLAGLMVEELGRLPAQGESLTLGALTLTVARKHGHRIDTIKVTKA
jgi:Mg2+/Co2+ transporter CorB